MAHGAITSGVWTHTNNAAATPTNPTQPAGATLLCFAFVRSATATLAVSGTGWTDADGITNPLTTGIAARLYVFQNETDGAGNPTVTPSGGAAGVTLSAGVLALVDRDKTQGFGFGTISTNGATAGTILLAQNSPSIDPGNAIIALGQKIDDWTVSPTLASQTAGLTWNSLVRESTTQGNDQSVVMDYAINDSGSAYTAGTGARWTGTWSSTVASYGIYLESVGAAGITGGLSVTEANDSVASASAVSIAAVLAKTESSDTVAAAGAVALAGSAAITEAGDTLSSASAVSNVGALAATEAGDTLSSASRIAIAASLAATEAGDSVSATAALAIKAALAVTEAADSLSATGLGNQAVEGALSGIEADDGLTATAVLPIVGSVAITEDDDRVTGIVRRHSRRTINPHTRDIQSRPVQQSEARPAQDNFARPAQHNVSRPRSISRGTR